MEYKGCLPKEQVEILSCMAAFAVVVEAGSFVDASLRLGVTASAVSKQVSKLESVLSLRLLERTTRQLKLNAEGVEIYNHCRDVLESSARVFRLKDRFLDGPQGLVRIAVSHSLYDECNKLISGFLEQYENVNVKMVAYDGVCDLIADDFDIAVMITDHPPEGQIARRLFRVGFELYASKIYLSKHGHPSHPSELIRHCCISFPDSVEGQRWKFKSVGDDFEVRVSGRYFPGSLEAVLNATISGLGISCLPESMVAGQVKARGLVRLFPEWTYMGASQGMAWVIYPPGRHVAQRVKFMVSHLVKELRLAGGGG